MSGSSLNGLDVVYVHFHESAGKWSFEIVQTECYPYSKEWSDRLTTATQLSAFEYQLLHTEYGHYIANQVNAFIDKYELHHNVHLIGCHGHTTFHVPAKRMTAQLGDGAAIAAQTGLSVVTDLRAMDIAAGGQGAPIVPIGEKLLFNEHSLLLNLGGIANISIKNDTQYIAFDICPANRVLNMLANKANMEYDAGGELAGRGSISVELLNTLNQQDYYSQSFPKSLSNDFGTHTIFSLIESADLSIEDALRTYVEHISLQVRRAIEQAGVVGSRQLLITGGGAFNSLLIERISRQLETLDINVTIPDASLVSYKEAVIMALVGILRWREEYNVLSEATGASRNTVGGALWVGGDA